jgi:hypothetical protein
MAEVGEQKSTLSSTEVDRHDERITKSIEGAPIYKKQGEVRAQIAQGGEVIITKLADGTTETRNTAQLGDAIITNPGGEQYIIGTDKFAKRYEPKQGEEGVFVAKGYCKAIDNPFGAPITMLASWGEMQNGQVDCKIADIFDPTTQELGGEPYIIGLSEFQQTYKPVEVSPQNTQSSTLS